MYRPNEWTVKAHIERRNWTELKWHGLVFDELTNEQAGRAHSSLADMYVISLVSPTLFGGIYCNALLPAHWSLRQKLNHVSSVQLRRSVRDFVFKRI